MPAAPLEDFVTRYDSEEFALIMPGADRTAALRFAGQATEAVAKLGIPNPSSDTQEKIVTISIGVAVAITERSEVARHQLIAGADKALYIAKRAGKNRVSENA